MSLMHKINPPAYRRVHIRQRFLEQTITIDSFGYTWHLGCIQFQCLLPGLACASVTFCSLFSCFSPRCTLVQSAVLRSHVVCPSVTLVDQDHIDWKAWKLTTRTISPTPSLFGAQTPSTYSQRNMGKFGGD